MILQHSVLLQISNTDFKIHKIIGGSLFGILVSSLVTVTVVWEMGHYPYQLSKSLQC